MGELLAKDHAHGLSVVLSGDYYIRMHTQSLELARSLGLGFSLPPHNKRLYGDGYVNCLIWLFIS